MASSKAALSRTEIDTQCWAPAPASVSPIGARLTRPRDGFSPNKPQRLAGIRIEPPPSVAWPIGKPRAATIAADPPDEPPGDRSLRHGLTVGPPKAGSVVGARPSSLVLVRPTITNPARRIRATAALSAGAAGWQARNFDPSVVVVPAHCAISCFTTNGTPWNGPSPAVAIDLSSSSPS